MLSLPVCPCFSSNSLDHNTVGIMSSMATSSDSVKLLVFNFCFADYWHQTPSDTGRKELEEEQFQAIAEFESILFPLYVLILNAQTDTPGYLCYSFMHFFPSYVQYLLQPAWMVANVGKVANSNEDNWWLGSAKFSDRNLNGKLKPEFTTTGTKVIGLMRKAKTELSPVAQKLIHRISVDFKKYSGLPTDTQLLAMMVNPLSLFVGFPLIMLQQEILLQNMADDADLHRNFLHEAHVLLYEALKERCTAMLSRDFQPPKPLAGLNSPRNARHQPDSDDYLATALLNFQRKQGAAPVRQKSEVLKVRSGGVEELL
jgi:hypothetical protein